MRSIPKVGYTGIGSYLPETELTNEDLSQIVDTTDSWIRRRTGICRRRILGRGETILDMAVPSSVHLTRP